MCIRDSEKEHRVEAGHRKDLGDVGLPEALDLEQRQRHERIAMALLVEQEQDDQRNGAGEFPESPGIAPADVYKRQAGSGRSLSPSSGGPCDPPDDRVPRRPGLPAGCRAGYRLVPLQNSLHSV